MRKVFIQKDSFLFLLALAVEQGIVASSTLWLVFLSKAISDGGSLLPPFLGFVASLTLVYIPSVWRRTYLSRAKNTALQRYLELCVTGLFCTPRLYRSKKFQHEKKGFIETESFLVIDEAFDFADYFLGLAINVTFNILALSFAFGSKLLLAYLSAAVIGALMTLVFTRKVKADAIEMQKSRTAAYSLLGDAWDAISLGNRYNLSLWERQFGEKLTAFKTRSAGAVFNIEAFTSLTLWLSVIPPVAVMAHIMFSGGSDIAVKTLVLATLPRQILVTQFIADLVNYLLKLGAVRERLRVLFGVPGLPADISGLTGTVDLSRISCVGPDGRQVELRSFSIPRSGRFTIRGGNGAGKTSLLMDIKMRNPEDSVILPAHNRLHFVATREQDLSTGQKALKALEELCELPSLKLVLLDEWDANLDRENMDRIDAAVAKLAERCCVVEIRHREGAANV